MVFESNSYENLKRPHLFEAESEKIVKFSLASGTYAWTWTNRRLTLYMIVSVNEIHRTKNQRKFTYIRFSMNHTKISMMNIFTWKILFQFSKPILISVNVIGFSAHAVQRQIVSYIIEFNNITDMRRHHYAWGIGYWRINYILVLFKTMWCCSVILEI